MHHLQIRADSGASGTSDYHSCTHFLYWYNPTHLNDLKCDVHHGVVQKLKHAGPMMAWHCHTQFDGTPATVPFLLPNEPTCLFEPHAHCSQQVAKETCYYYFIEYSSLFITLSPFRGIPTNRKSPIHMPHSDCKRMIVPEVKLANRCRSVRPHNALEVMYTVSTQNIPDSSVIMHLKTTRTNPGFSH
ncbi:hypothetical protein T265_05361 [Opisthorchis viverrini]|uniref:Uncharacterized protein n=1 Tax=Opisthorchis viverrini TaxID=6198 RepID=A0A074ZPA2_OPIVI|nr:hypothetical protein T265_05361 [Opisthorchis viverrini]KER27642.1 hypothetical protein T265_05361 [Opisthorchis viverrini]